MNINEFDVSECCGCTACEMVCPKNSIKMVENKNGFLYPEINKKTCVNCGLCVKVCDFKKFQIKKQKINCFAVKHKDINEVNTSRSGAFFIALGYYVIEKKGVVFGCSQIDKKTIIHKCITNKDELIQFKGSKYVQSDLKNTFRECKKYLENNRIVLFSGTGCQVHGLISYLNFKKVNTDQLITCDIVCHGVPSPKIWRQYVDRFEKNKKITIDKVNFRDKEKYGWRAHYESFTTIEGNKIYSRNWTNLFYKHLMFRESCYNCKYTTPYRYSDFTIADYWGIENNVKKFDDDKGVSLVIVRGKKGNIIFNKLKDQLIYEETNIETSLQPQLIHPIEKGRKYEKFWEEYYSNEDKTIKKYFFPSKIKIFVEKVLRRIRKMFIK